MAGNVDPKQLKQAGATNGQVLTWNNTPTEWEPQTPSGGTDNDAIHDNAASEISAVTEKTTPVSADLVLIEDSADSNAKKRVQVGNLPSTFDVDTIVVDDTTGAVVTADGDVLVNE